MELIYFVLICFGMTQIICFGTIFDSIRPNYDFFRCPMCIGFWVGSFVWALSPFTKLFTFDYDFVTAFFLACLSSGTSYVMNMAFSDTGFQLGINKAEVKDVTHNN